MYSRLDFTEYLNGILILIKRIIRLYRVLVFFFFSSRRRHTRFDCDWSSDVCSSDLLKFSSINNRSGTVEAAVSAAKHSKYQATRLSLQSTPDQRDSAGRIGNSNFSVWRITVRLALTPICSPTKTLCKSCTLPMG